MRKAAAKLGVTAKSIAVDYRGRVSEGVHEMAQQQFGARVAGMEIYFAGPPAMAQAVQKMLLETGVAFSQVHFDQFY